MRTHISAKSIHLVLLFLTVGAHGVTIQRTSLSCTPDLTGAIKTVSAIDFPTNWRVVLVCDQQTWDYLRLRADATATRTAFTNLKGGITVVNWQIFARPSIGRSAERVLLHELGHIICKCGEHSRAESYAEMYEKQSRQAKAHRTTESATAPPIQAAASEQTASPESPPF